MGARVTNMNKPPTISLNLMPAFYHKHTGVTYGEAYYFDPGHRARVERVEGVFQYEAWGRHGVGSPDPQPSPNLFIQSIDLILRTQGAQWRFPEDACLESWGEPWAGLSIAEIEALDPRDAAHHPVVDAVLDQYRELERLYGERADVFGLKSGCMTIHTPYTAAHQLRGQGLFIEMVTDPEGARVILEKVWEVELAVHGRIAEALGARSRYVHLGDCSASLLSARTYREVVLPVNQRLAREFGAAGYHSCGPSTHLLAEFRAIPHLDSLQLGQGTDLTEAVRLFPGVHLMPMVDSVVLRQEGAEAVRELVVGMLEAASPAPQVTLLAWALDRETPIGNVGAMYEALGS